MISVNQSCCRINALGCCDSPDNRSARLLLVAFVTLIWTTTLLSSREISSVPSSRLLKRRSPSEFHVRNWKLRDIVLWLARPGSCRKLVALKKTGKVWVSTQEKDRLRCREKDTEKQRQWEVINWSSEIKDEIKANPLNMGLYVKLFDCFQCPTWGNHVFIHQAFVPLNPATACLPSDVPDWSYIQRLILLLQKCLSVCLAPCVWNQGWTVTWVMFVSWRKTNTIVEFGTNCHWASPTLCC